ncbi:hypothetical protein [Micromonospora sp. WMMD736]|uniref:hypothetical protein n=1 Tax=Micromonospora sp. WMMD736 TaxID=3404112 RepID=UPI003B946DCF
MAVGGSVTPPRISDDGTVALVAVPLAAADDDIAAQVPDQGRNDSRPAAAKQPDPNAGARGQADAVTGG